MKSINWKVRLKNKAFWITIIPMVFVLVHQILIIFGIDLDLTNLASQLVDIVETVFMILGVLGIIVDPTTIGIGDSSRALGYEEPSNF